MMISETARHFFHIKVTAGSVRGGRGEGLLVVERFCAELPLENTGLFGFYVCMKRLEFPFCRTEEGF